MRQQANYMSKLFELSNNLIELDLRIQDILVDESLSDEEREKLSNELLKHLNFELLHVH